jgi:AcrR family transcriptional regulator
MSDESPMRRIPRQQRSQKRVDEILQATSQLLQEVGYEGMTTTLIAERAGIPVSSLYQFFANKDAILHSLASRYLEDLQTLRGRMFTPDSIYVPTPILFERTVDILVEYSAAHPGSQQIFSSPWVSSELLAVSEAMTAGMIDQIAWILETKAPGLAPTTRAVCAQTLMHVIKGLLPMIEDAGFETRDPLIEEFKRVGLAYLRDILDRQNSVNDLEK